MSLSKFVAILCLATVLVAAPATKCRAQSGVLLGNPQVSPLGLETAWSSFVRVDPARGRVKSLQLMHGKLVAQTNQGTLQVMNPESGRTLWMATVGNPNYETQAPSSNGKFTAVTNGSTLYLFDADTGAQLWTVRVSGSPCAGSAMSADRVYVPLDNGIIEAYLLVRDEGRELFDSIPKRYSGAGGAVTAPLVVGTRCSWSVSQGFVYSAEETFKNLDQFRFRVDGDLSAGPAAMPGELFAASRSGTVYALNGDDGGEIWRFSLGNAVSHPLITIDGALYIISEAGDMVRLDARVGRQIWYGRGVQQFVAAGAERIYVTDIQGRLSARNAATGTVLGAVAASGFNLPCYNMESDRLYLASSTGIVQCLREPQAVKPLMHTPGPPMPAAPAAADGAPAVPADGAAPAVPVVDPNNPFGAGS